MAGSRPTRRRAPDPARCLRSASPKWLAPSSAGRRTAVALALISTSAWAQSDLPLADVAARGYYVTPSVALQATATNNVQLSATNQQSDIIAQVIPAVQIGGQTAHLKGFLNYSLTASAYAQDRAQSNLQNSLNSQLSVEAVDDWLFVDASASISQEYVSPFGTQAPDSTLVNSNRTEVSTVTVSPYIRGQVGGYMDYLASLNYGYTSSGTGAAADSAYWGGLLRFNGNTRWSRLQWAVDLSYRQVDFTDQSSRFDQLLVGSLTYAVMPDLKLSLRANGEVSDVTTGTTERSSGWGWGLQWNPSPRTHLFLEQDQRIFGSSNLYGLIYRTPRTVWGVSGRQGLSTGAFNAGRGNPTSPFDLLFAQFATLEPDPVTRAQFIDAFMRSNGIAANASMNSGYLPDQVTEERRQELSAALLGLRTTVIVNVYQTYARGLGPPPSPDSLFADGNVIRWLGFGLNVAHRLTPHATLNLNAAQQRTTESVGGEETNLWTVSAMLSTQLSTRVQASLLARRSVFSSTTSPYNESALVGTVNLQF